MLLPVIAQSLLLTGIKRAWIVHDNGLDEIALHGTTQLIEITNGIMQEKTISPKDFGLARYTNLIN